LLINPGGDLNSNSIFSEKLKEYEKIEINHETIRRWMRSSGIITSERKKRPHRKKRERRKAIGEMLQFDGSHHDWFVRRTPLEKEEDLFVVYYTE